MVLTRRPHVLCVRLCCLAVLVVMTGLPVGVGAVGKDKALLVGSTSRGFQQEATQVGKWINRISPIEGTIDVGSDAELTFDAGSRWSAKIPYAAITRLTYGLEAAYPARGLSLAYPWSGSSQFTDKPHYVLTVIYRIQIANEQSEVFELGKNLIRPVLEALEHRTARRVEFLSFDACIKLKSLTDCGFGNPEELRGLKRVHIDTRGNTEHREHIVAEIEKAALGLEVVAAAGEAEISLRFHGQRFFEAKTIDGGRGEVSVLRTRDPRVVLLFVDRDTSVWGRAPSINFGGEFVKAYRKANDR